MNKSVIAELEDIRVENGGILKPEDVVERASDPSNVLHSRFTWDDTEAAQQYRLWQARHLIKICVTVLPNRSESTQVYVSLKSDRIGDTGYRPVVDVLADVELRQQLLSDALEDLKRFQHKYAELKELAEVFDAAKRARLKYAARVMEALTV